MHFKQKLTYMALGGLLVLAGYILASLANDSIAQSGAQDVTFGTITCRRLEVVDDEGKKSVELYTDEHSGVIGAYGKDGGLAGLANDEHGGVVVAKGKDGGLASLGIDEHGGYVWANGKDGGLVKLTINPYGGAMTIFNKGMKNVLQTGVGDMGQGIIETSDKNGRLREYVHDKSEKKPVHSLAAMSFQDLLDGYITADDGQFLGRITTNEYGSDSILNDYGDHGSEYSSDSIFNDYGSYGGEYSAESAFNDMASSPPRVYTKDGHFVGYLTTNDFKNPRIHTLALIGWLKSQ